MKEYKVSVMVMLLSGALCAFGADSTGLDCCGRCWELPPAARFDGRMLRIVSPEGSRKATFAQLPLDLKPYDGDEVRVTIRAEGKGVSEPKERWNGVKVMLKYRDRETDRFRYPQAYLPRGDFAGEYSFIAALYDVETDDAKLCLGLEGASGEVSFDLESLKFERCHGESIRNPDYKVKYSGTHATRAALRGCMVSPNVTEKDLADLAGWGAKLIRYQILPYGSFGLKGANEDEKIACFNSNLVARIDFIDRDVLGWARKYGFKVVIDMHMYPEDTIYTSAKSRDAFVAAWRSVARRFKGAGDVVYGYDLMNEPVGHGRDVPWTYLDLQELCAKEIRAIDPNATVIVASGNGDSPGSFESLGALAMDNVIYTVHVYEPLTYTHQFVMPKVRPERAKKSALPENLEKHLRATLAPVRRFQLRHGCRILVGEFSAVVWADRAGEYLETCIRLFEEYGWDWTYHAFRESTLWSVEHEADRPPDIRKPSADNPRKRALLNGLGNGAGIPRE